MIPIRKLQILRFVGLFSPHKRILLYFLYFTPKNAYLLGIVFTFALPQWPWFTLNVWDTGHHIWSLYGIKFFFVHLESLRRIHIKGKSWDITTYTRKLHSFCRQDLIRRIRSRSDDNNNGAFLKWNKKSANWWNLINNKVWIGISLKIRSLIRVLLAL